MSRLARAILAILSRIDLFSRAILRMPLRGYQQRPLRPIIRSVLQGEGREFLLIFPRQSGKNEAVAHLLVYLLNLLQRVGGNVVYGATGDGLGRGMRRLEERLDNRWNHGRWGKAGRPLRLILGKAAVVFLSTHPQASARGETAHWLLVIDELQDQDAAHLEAVFEPMRSARNASALYIGTVRLTTDALWQKKLALEAEERHDGHRRVYQVSPRQVIRENPAYGRFLESKIRRLGRDHPIVASEYFLQPIDGSGRLFPPRRQALMRGRHPRLQGPPAGIIAIATIDIGGQDEATTDPVARLANPGRDYTVSHVFQVVMPGNGAAVANPTAAPLPHLPIYHALNVFVDHGSRHFQDAPGVPSLIKRLAAWLRMWEVQHIFVDSSGVGEGIADWLSAAFGRDRVTGYSFQGPGKKAALGSAFLSLVETGRFQYWTSDSGGDLPGPADPKREDAYGDGWWFWQQVGACTYELPPGGRFDRDLRWGVPANARVSTPTGSRLIHDDRLLSAALIALADDLVRSGRLSLGQGRSIVIQPRDPLQNLRF